MAISWLVCLLWVVSAYASGKETAAVREEIDEKKRVPHAAVHSSGERDTSTAAPKDERQHRSTTERKKDVTSTAAPLSLTPSPMSTLTDTLDNYKVPFNLTNVSVTSLMSEVGPLGFPLWYTAAALVAFLLSCCLWSCAVSIACPVKEDSREFHPKNICERKPTDILCLTVFCTFLYGMTIVVHYAYTNGNPKRLTHGFDYQGQLCGVDEDVLDKPFLFWCPAESNSFDFNDPASFQSTPGTKASSPINFNSPICMSMCPQGDTEVLCPQPSKATTVSQGMRTITTVVEQLKWRPTYRSKQVMGIYCVPDAPPESVLMQLVLKHTSINGPSEQIFRAIGSLHRATSVFFCSAAAAIVLSVVYIVLLSRLAKCLIYSTLAILTMVFASCSAFFLITAYTADTAELVSHVSQVSSIAHPLGQLLQSHNVTNPMFSSLSRDQAVIWSYALGSTLFFIVLGMICVLCCCARTLNTAAALVDAAADCMLAMWSLVLEAIIDMLFRLALVFTLVYGLIWVVSCGEARSNNGATIGGQHVTGMSRSLTFTREQKYMVVYYIFGSFWIMELANAIGQFVISYMIVLWYYSPKDMHGCKVAPGIPLLRAYFAAFFCHLGSLAVGSFTIAVVRLAKLALGALAAHAKGSGNKVMECVAKSLGCIIECFQNCMEFLNKNAYIDIAINSNNFCMAARHSFDFMLRNAGEIVVLNGSCLVFQVIGVLSVMGLTGTGAYAGLTHMSEYTSESSPSYVPMPTLVAAVAGCIGGLIAMVFMLVFDQTADTLLYTFTWNKSKGGPASTGSFAPKALIELDGGRSGTATYTPLTNHEY